MKWIALVIDHKYGTTYPLGRFSALRNSERRGVTNDLGVAAVFDTSIEALAFAEKYRYGIEYVGCMQIDAHWAE